MSSIIQRKGIIIANETSVKDSTKNGICVGYNFDQTSNSITEESLEQILSLLKINRKAYENYLIYEIDYFSKRNQDYPRLFMLYREMPSVLLKPVKFKQIMDQNSINKVGIFINKEHTIFGRSFLFSPDSDIDLTLYKNLYENAKIDLNSLSYQYIPEEGSGFPLQTRKEREQFANHFKNWLYQNHIFTAEHLPIFTPRINNFISSGKRYTDAVETHGLLPNTMYPLDFNANAGED